MKERLDVLLVKRNLAESREKAKAVIMSGIVYVDGQKGRQGGIHVRRDSRCGGARNHIKICEPRRTEIGEGHDTFRRDIRGKICMDVGASTGGFTDCMLQNGAVKVYSVDVGHGQLAWKLRNDEARGLHGKDKYPLCDSGGDPGQDPVCIH